MRLLLITQVVDTKHPILGFFHAWLIELAKHMEHVEVIALQVGEYHLPENVTIHSLGKESGVSFFKKISTLIRLVRTLKYDAVFVHMNVEYLILFGWYWKMQGIPSFLWYVHRSVSLRLRLAHSFVSHVFSTGPESFRLRSKKVSFVGHGMPHISFTPRERKVCSALSVGRISPAKRIREVCQVAVAAEVPCTIVGAPATPRDETYFVSVFEEYGDTVSFTGGMPHEELGKYYKEAGIFLHMSDTGSTDKVVLEAMQYGVLPVSTSSAFKDVLEPYGLFVSSGDVAGMVEVVRRVKNMNSGERTQIEEVLAAYVRDTHALDALMVRLSTEMKAYV